LRYIKRISNFSHEESEDILQEAFIKTYRNLNNFDKDLKFSSWIYRIVRNEVIGHYRKAKVRPQNITWDTEGIILNNIASDFDIHKDIELKYLNKNLNKVLSKMDKKYSEVLVLKYWEEKDYKEISDILKKPMGTVATLLSRAKKQFGEEFKKQDIKL
jgi:RNA polymerase sigma-70 factor (ECF subfamily)